MKNMYKFLSLILIFVFGAVTSPAQPTCDNPEVLIQDDFESYNLGALGPQADHWTTWSGDEGGDEDGLVVNNNAASGNQSIFFQGASGGGPQDVVLNLGDHDSGMYLLNWNMLIPEGAKAYFNLQRSTIPGEEYAVEVLFDGALNLGAIFLNNDQFLFPFVADEWFEVRFTIDTDNDRVILFIAGNFVYSWPLSDTSTDPGTLGSAFGAVDFYPADDTHFFWVDDIYFAQIPAAEPGKYCYMAETITEGTHTIDSIDCFGAGFTVRSGGQGLAGRWFEWTAPDDGIMTLTSCGNGSDSRVWIFSGDCSTLQIEGVNDDRCGLNMAGSQEWASYREVMVTAGETYLICWDDVWEGDVPFSFDLSFTTDAPADGDFCQTAIAVNAGDTITIDQINGDAAVAGPNIGHFGSSTTPYSQSEWYSFTPDANGLMSISSCGMTTEDTRLWVYTGTCGLTSLELIANDDDGCDLQSIVDSLQVTAGTTYYIEWDSEDTDAPGFNWTLQFEPEVGTQETATLPGSFRLSPNPATNSTVLTYELNTPSELQVRLFNYTGKEVLNYNSLNNTQKGEITLNLSELPQGFYLVQISNGQQSISKKLAITR